MRSYRLFWMIGISVGLVTVGTLGYYFLEGWPFFDALYMTVTTLTTVGYGRAQELDARGKVFTMLLLVGGVFTFFFTTTEILRAIVSGELQAFIGRRRMEHSLASLKNHLIICGLGRMGRSVCQQFSRRAVCRLSSSTAIPKCSPISTWSTVLPCPAMRPRMRF